MERALCTKEPYLNTGDPRPARDLGPARVTRARCRIPARALGALGAGLRTPTESPTDRSQAPRTKPSPIANIRFRSADRRKETLRSGTRAGSRDPRPAHGPLWSARSLLPLSGPIKVAASRRTPKSALGAGLRSPTESPTDRSHAPRTKPSPTANIRFRSADRRKETLRSGTRAGSRDPRPARDLGPARVTWARCRIPARALGALGAGLWTPTERPTDRSHAPRTKPSPIANMRFRSADRRKETLRSGTRAGSRDPRPARDLGPARVTRAQRV
jgi:hypothetical protein